MLGPFLSSSPEMLQRWGEACLSRIVRKGQWDWPVSSLRCMLGCSADIELRPDKPAQGQGPKLKRVGLESSLLWHTAIEITGSSGHVSTCSPTFYPILRHAPPMTGSTVELCEASRPFSGIKGQPILWRLRWLVCSLGEPCGRIYLVFCVNYCMCPLWNIGKMRKMEGMTFNTCHNTFKEWEKCTISLHWFGRVPEVMWNNFFPLIRDCQRAWPELYYCIFRVLVK